MKTTIKQVAIKAGVSTMTVSRVVNNYPNIKPETRDKVQKVIEEIHYKPNEIARTLVVQKSKIISLMVPDIVNPFFTEMIKCAEQDTKKLGYNLLIADAGWTIQNEIDFVQASIGRMSDGVILVTPRLSKKQISELNQQVPIVVVDRNLREKDIKCVFVDNYYGVYKGVEYLISLGHKNIGYIKGIDDVQNTKRREQGYIDALKAHGIKYNPDNTTEGGYTSKTGYAAYDFFFSKKIIPTAIFASNDLMAYGLISACKDHGLNVPNDISIMGFDNISLPIDTTPSLTTISHPINKMINKAISILLNQKIDEKDKLKNELIIRDSVKKLEV